MDKLKDNETKSKKVSEKSFLSRLAGNEGEAGGSFGGDLFFFTLAFLFSRCHLFFGAYPMSVALLSLLPHSVLPALAGGALGAITLGAGGIVNAAVLGAVFLLRLIVSSDKTADSGFFGESLILRMSVAVICGFCAGVCEVILRGITLSSMLYGLTMVFVPPLGVFALSGLFGEKINLGAVVSSDENQLSVKNKTAKESLDVLFFEISSLIALFFITLSVKELVFFGISIPFVFVSFITLLVAKRFGAFRAGAVGFVSALSCGGVYTVSFALAGLGAGAFFSLGTGYALAVGLGCAALWGYYTGGVVGLLSVVPEFVIAAALVSPLLKSLPTPEPEKNEAEVEKSAREMVGTVALSYQNKYSRSLDLLEMALSSLSGVISEYSSSETAAGADELRALVISTADEHCKNCTGRKFCMIENIRPCMTNVDSIVKKLRDGVKICPEDVNGDTEFCQKAEAVAESVNERVAKAEENSFRLKDADATAEEYALISKLINEARCRDEEERRVNSSLTESLAEAIEKGGFGEGVIRAFGNRRKHIILAGEDESGEVISSQRLRREIEKAIGVRLAAPDFYRRGKMALMECDVARAFAVEYATASASGDEKEVSGDTVSFFESSDDSFFALISDGMGRGNIAKETSSFVSKFLSRALDFGATKETLLCMLNYVIRRKGEECSATVDLFEFDLLSGDAVFMKSGAAPSFVKRESSLFRIRSQSAPIGLLKTVDTEKIRVEIKPGDFVVMLSDGILQTAEDAPWLIEMIANTKAKTTSALANEILEGAKRNAPAGDDMSVAVLLIKECRKGE